MCNNCCQRLSLTPFGNVAEKLGEMRKIDLIPSIFAYDSIVQTAPPLVADERSLLKRPFLLPFADTGRYPRTH